MRISTFLVSRAVPGWTFARRHAERIEAALPGASVRICPDADAFVGALPETEVALAWRFEQAWLDRAPRLRWLATPAAGKDYFHLDPPPSLRITYGGFHGVFMGETVLGMLLAECRGLRRAEQLRARDPWPRAALAATMRTLRGAHLVILGFGSIGAWIGRLAKPFGVHVTGVRRRAAPPPDWFGPDDRLARVDTLDDLLPTADHLVLVLPGGPETDRILDARRLALLPAHAAVYNVGRGNAIDVDALVASLEAGRLASAWLDVFPEEPLPAEHPLRACERAFLMPHASAIAPDYLDRFVDEVIQRAPAVWGGARTPDNQADAGRWQNLAE